MGAGEKRGLPMETGLLGLDMMVEFEIRGEWFVKNGALSRRQPKTDR
jgi:hypothetical protein